MKAGQIQVEATAGVTSYKFRPTIVFLASFPELLPPSIFKRKALGTKLTFFPTDRIRRNNYKKSNIIAVVSREYSSSQGRIVVFHSSKLETDAKMIKCPAIG